MATNVIKSRMHAVSPDHVETLILNGRDKGDKRQYSAVQFIFIWKGRPTKAKIKTMLRLIYSENKNKNQTQIVAGHFHGISSILVLYLNEKKLQNFNYSSTKLKIIHS